ncbi:dihydropyrimidine dehydrogenase subunit B [Iodidimonas gelatinilytica]|uniref:dihydrouracil dehydrogenase (NAD(+)) n=1 Tax=Iodidimonas gelatinilytica TaxID=1236966 RepID=A0A5A7MNP3_9PROT|nr:NAD-dependent dihydropyrimidine dehydrogenase subunit PreA [Iodidimonas gelatinilytica]GEQ96519.1 dihydropyrimidine dehydrogenase subunit B [Iodidimonas gelatinilytica]GER00159.1 dihydropyrimidine dehydrogenase subunit B [Iodidimonas gelatinilytica]
MADLSCTIAGIPSINPFWLASAPPTDKKYNVVRAFEKGWGGVVWKTLGEDPPVVNVTSRYGLHKDFKGATLGINNNELISDRPLAVNLREIEECRREWPDRVIIGSMMAVMEERAWKDLAIRIAASGVHGIELNLGCPHGMCERGMGSAIGQVPEMVEKTTRWVREVVDIPVFTKLTPNITDILVPAEAALQGGAHAVSLINTVNSIISVNLDHMAPNPMIDNKGTHGGYCGSAVKPIALNMVAEIARNHQTRDLEISAIGGINTWRDAAEFIALGASGVQVCTSAMLYGFRIVEDMIDGLSNWMDEKGYRTLDDFRGKAIPNTVNWNELNMNFDLKARIDEESCIECGRCHIACEDTSHQAIRIEAKDGGGRRFVVIDDDCVGCNLCQHVCPVDGCINMEEVNNGLPVLTWPDHPKNPANKAAAE